MTERYKSGWTDPRAMYGSAAVELEEPEVKWEFLEAQPWQPSIRPWFGVLMAYIFIRILL